jgi:chromosome partitioning protein
MIILCGNQKGGVGKTTMAINLCAVLADQLSKDVILVDSDHRQPSSSEWWADRKVNHPDRPLVHHVQKYGDIDETLLDLDKRYEFVIVDVAGRGESDEMLSTMTVCDKLLMPFRASQPDINTIRKMSILIKNSKRNNPKMEAYAFINVAPTNPSLKDEIESAKTVILDFPEITLLNTVIHDRRVYRDAYIEGLGVTEMSGKSDSEISSRREMLELVNEVIYGN